MLLGVFGVSLNSLLIRALGVRSDNFPRALVRDGLITTHRIRGYPSKLYVLTPAGHAIAELLLQRRVRQVRGDKVTTSQLAHDLMTQACVLSSLEEWGRSSSLASVDVAAFLRHCLDSRDLGRIDKAVRPDLHYLWEGQGFSWETENNPASSSRLKTKFHLLLRESARFSKLTVVWAINGGPDVIERYRRCFDEVLEEANSDGISRTELSRVRCQFKSAETLLGIR